MRHTALHTIKRLVMLSFMGAVTTIAMQAQEALHLFHKNGAHKKVTITEDTQIEFAKHPYMEVMYSDAEKDVVHISASAGRTIGLGYVRTNMPWTVSEDASWLMVRYEKLDKYKYPVGDGIKEIPFLIFAEANKTGEERTATITFTPKGGESKTLTVVQHSGMLSLTPIGSIHGFDPTTTKEESIAWNTTRYYAYVYPNFDVKVLSKPNWMELDTIAYGADGFSLDKVAQVSDEVHVTGENINSDVTVAIFSIEQNRTSKSRTGNIIFELNGETAVLAVTQEGLTDATLLSSLEDMQQWMATFGVVSSSHDDFSHMSVLHATDMMGEDMTMFKSSWFKFDYEHDNNSANYGRNRINWQTYYGMVTRANTAIDLALDVQNEVNNENFVLGNAYAYRAMAYLYLVQLFQDPTTENGINESLPGVPLLYAESEKAVMTEGQIEYFKGRNTVGEVFAQIEADITRAIELLQGESRPSKNYIDVTVAQGIAARYYLLIQQWQKAATMANAARNSYRLMDGNTEKNGIRDGFMDITNEEWMWGFDHTSDTQTTYASFFSHISNLSPGYSGIGYTGRGVDARLFEQMPESDLRRHYWYRDADGQTQSTAEASPGAYMWQYPYAFLKFGWKEDWTQDYVYMRAAEMVLIETEAWAKLGEVDNATQTFAELMTRRDPDWHAHVLTLEDIYLQRRLELIGEGHAYFDLKRLNKGIERDYNGSNHLDGFRLNVAAADSTWVYKIPQSAIDDDYTYNLTEEDNLWTESVYLREINYTSYYTGDTIFMSASAGRAYTYGRVESNYPWTVTDNADWLLVRTDEKGIYASNFSGEHAYENIFMIYAQANNTNRERTATVTIASSEKGAKKTFTVVQRPYTLTFNEADYVRNGRYDGEKYDNYVLEGTWDWNNIWFNLLPNHGWQVTSYPDWMVMSEFVHGEQSCSFEDILANDDILNAGTPIVSSVKFQFKPNESAEPREATIVFEGNGQKAVATYRQEGLNEQAIFNASATLLKRMYQYDELGNGSHDDFGFPSLMLAMDSRGTDLVSEDTGYNWFTQFMTYNDVNSNLRATALYWTIMYNQVQAANEVIGTYKSRAGQSLFQFYLAQAHVLRAFNYFYLVQLYQHTYAGNEDQYGVPLIHEDNMAAVNTQGCPRARVSEVYEFILNDLTEALDLLEKTSVERPGGQYINADVVYALRARIYMVMNRWEAAAADAQRVIDSGKVAPYSRDEVSRPTFTDINHKSWIWGIDTEETDRVVTTGIVNWPSHMGSFNYGYAQVGAWRRVNRSLYLSIPTTDVRKGWFLNGNRASNNLTPEYQNYVNSSGIPAYTQVKFAPYNDEIGTTVNANDIPLIRVEEMYLILAEARAMMGEVTKGAEVLNSFVANYRDPAYNCTASTAEELVDAVWMQRRIELWGEGHSYFDLMRLGKGVDRRGAGFAKDYTYNISAGDAALIYPIPDREMNLNMQLVQNPVADQPIAVDDSYSYKTYCSGVFTSGLFGSWNQDMEVAEDDNTVYRLPGYIAEDYDLNFYWDAKTGDLSPLDITWETGYVHSKYGMLNATCYGIEYDAEAKIFTFQVEYTCTAGTFGTFNETFTVGENNNEAVRRTRLATKKDINAITLELESEE